MYKAIKCKRCKVIAVVHKNSLCARLRLCIVCANDHAEREQKASKPEPKAKTVPKNPWSDDEIEILKKYVATKSGQELADMLNRTYQSVANRLSRLRAKGELEW